MRERGGGKKFGTGLDGRGAGKPPSRQRGMAMLEFLIAAAATGLLIGGVMAVSGMSDHARETRSVGDGAERGRVIRDLFARDVSASLADSVRIVRLPGGGSRVEMVPILGSALISTGGASDLAACPSQGAGDALSFDEPDSCLKTSGRAGLTILENPPSETLHVAIPGAGSGAFWRGGPVGTGSRRTLGSFVLGSEEARLEIAAGATPIERGDSSGSLVVVGPPVAWECDLATGELRREEGIAWSETPVPGSRGTSSSRLAEGVEDCSFVFGDPSLWERTSLLLSFDRIELADGYEQPEPPPDDTGEGAEPPVGESEEGGGELVPTKPPFDSSARPKTVSAIGETEQIGHDMNETFLGAGSGRFAGGRLLVPPSFELDFGPDDFVVDLRVRTGGEGIILAFDRDGGYGPLVLVADASGTLLVYSSSSGSEWDVLSGEVLGIADPVEWEHVAVVRAGGRIMGFLRGRKVFDRPVSGSLAGATAGLGIGAGTDGRLPWTGRLDEIRVARAAAWTADFEPPTTVHAKSSSALSMRVESLGPKGDRRVVSVASRPRPR
jgi:hypothetical protein